MSNQFQPNERHNRNLLRRCFSCTVRNVLSKTAIQSLLKHMIAKGIVEYECSEKKTKYEEKLVTQSLKNSVWYVFRRKLIITIRNAMHCCSQCCRWWCLLVFPNDLTTHYSASFSTLATKFIPKPCYRLNLVWCACFSFRCVLYIPFDSSRTCDFDGKSLNLTFCTYVFDLELDFICILSTVCFVECTATCVFIVGGAVQEGKKWTTVKRTQSESLLFNI